MGGHGDEFLSAAAQINDPRVSSSANSSGARSKTSSKRAQNRATLAWHLAEVLGLLRWLRLGLFNRERLEAVSEVLRVLRDVLEVLGKKRENVSISRQKMTRTKGGKGRVGRRALVLDEFVAQRHTSAE